MFILWPIWCATTSCSSWCFFCWWWLSSAGLISQAGQLWSAAVASSSAGFESIDAAATDSIRFTFGGNGFAIISHLLLVCKSLVAVRQSEATWMNEWSVRVSAPNGNLNWRMATFYLFYTLLELFSLSAYRPILYLPPSPKRLWMVASLATQHSCQTPRRRKWAISQLAILALLSFFLSLSTENVQ